MDENPIPAWNPQMAKPIVQRSWLPTGYTQNSLCFARGVVGEQEENIAGKSW